MLSGWLGTPLYPLLHLIISWNRSHPFTTKWSHHLLFNWRYIWITFLFSKYKFTSAYRGSHLMTLTVFDTTFHSSDSGCDTQFWSILSLYLFLSVSLSLSLSICVCAWVCLLSPNISLIEVVPLFKAQKFETELWLRLGRHCVWHLELKVANLISILTVFAKNPKKSIKTHMWRYH